MSASTRADHVASMKRYAKREQGEKDAWLERMLDEQDRDPLTTMSREERKAIFLEVRGIKRAARWGVRMGAGA